MNWGRYFWILFLVPCGILQASPYENLERYAAKIFPFAPNESSSYDAGLIKAYIRDTLIKPGPGVHRLAILCGWTEETPVHQREQHDLSLRISVFDFEQQEWVLTNRRDGFQCGNEEVFELVGQLVPGQKAKDAFSFTPVRLEIMTNNGGSRSLYQSVSLVAFTNPALKEAGPKPKAVVFDLDQTLTQMHADSVPMRDYPPFPPMIEEVLRYRAEGIAIFYVTARTGAGREVSQAWLRQQGLPPGPLFMRDRLADVMVQAWEDDDLVSQNMMNSKEEAITRIRDSFEVVAAYGDAWTDMELYQRLKIPEVVHVNWLDDDCSNSSIIESFYHCYESQDYTQRGYGAVRVDRYQYDFQADEAAQEELQLEAEQEMLAGNTVVQAIRKRYLQSRSNRPQTAPAHGRSRRGQRQSHSEPVSLSSSRRSSDNFDPAALLFSGTPFAEGKH
ncbi:LNS2 domain-containing protein [Parendozoicomonas haliclonae]|uniref:LNS2 domain-containing protein n=1 Tax=Parendozoicomonas haliclonae TaxID=1960125 RepID=UPI000B356627|nr:HAD family acid phosphatase [Parendozoicomonas haliclonae]